MYLLERWINDKCKEHHQTCEPFCCDLSNKILYLLEDEARLFLDLGIKVVEMTDSKAEELKPTELTLMHIEESMFPYRLAGGLCPYVKKRRCTIQESKPEGCREWPLSWNMIKLIYCQPCPIITPKNMEALSQVVQHSDHKLSSKLRLLTRQLREEQH